LLTFQENTLRGGIPVRRSSAIVFGGFFLVLLLLRSEFANSGEFVVLKNPGTALSAATRLPSSADYAIPPLKDSHKPDGGEEVEIWPSFQKGFLSSKKVLEEIGGSLEIFGDAIANRESPEMTALKESVNFTNIAPPPHVGFCWDRQVGEKKQWEISLNLGVAFPGLSDVEPESKSSQAPSQKYSAEADDDGENFLKSASPFIGLGIIYRF